MKKLVILDYCTAKVHIYKTDRKKDFTDEDVVKLGYSLNNCNWMYGNIKFEEHPGILL